MSDPSVQSRPMRPISPISKDAAHPRGFVEILHVRRDGSPNSWWLITYKPGGQPMRFGPYATPALCRAHFRRLRAIIPGLRRYRISNSPALAIRPVGPLPSYRGRAYVRAI